MSIYFSNGYEIQWEAFAKASYRFEHGTTMGKCTVSHLISRLLWLLSLT